MNEKEDKSLTQRESEIWNAIEAFEQILAAMPDDRTALETLASAYEQIGDEAHALKHLLRLAYVVVSERDAVLAGKLAERIRLLSADGDPKVHKALAELDKLMQADADKPVPRQDTDERLQRRLDITQELTLAWELLQAEEITQDDYTSIVHDLSESSGRNQQSPITVLHMLEYRHFKGLPRILAFLALKSGLPYVDVERYDARPEVLNLLPAGFSNRQGALVFELMGTNALVCVLNPFDHDLRQEVEKRLDRTCRFFLTSASSYDKFLEKGRPPAG